MQITGRANVRAFRDWCRKLMNSLVVAGAGNAALPVPDFENIPDAMLTDPWEGLGPLWYWDSCGLNRYADQGDVEMVTKRINGGLTGYQDRLDWHAKVALALLGYRPNDVAAFQKQTGEKADGIAGPRTRTALHRALVKLTTPVLQASEVQAAPDVEERKVDKPVVPASVEEKVKEKADHFGWLTGIFGGGTGLGFLTGMDWQAILAVGGVTLMVLILVFIFRHQASAVVKELRT